MNGKIFYIKAAGFDSTLLWYGNNETEGRKERILLAEKYNLHIENVHTPTEHLNAIWTSGDERGTNPFKTDASDSGLRLKTIVLHWEMRDPKKG